MKKFLGLLLAAMMLLSMVSVASAEATTITVWCTDGAETQIYTEMWNQFNANNTDIQVNYLFFAQDELLNKVDR